MRTLAWVLGAPRRWLTSAPPSPRPQGPFPPHAFVPRSTRIEIFWERVETALTPRRLLTGAVTLALLAIGLSVLLAPAPWVWWPAPIAPYLPWSRVSVSDRLALASMLASLSTLIGLVLTIAAGIVQLRAFVPASQELRFRADEQARTPTGVETWRLRIWNAGAFANFYRVEVVVSPQPAAFDGSPGWVFESTRDSGHGADTWVLDSRVPLYPGQFLVGPVVKCGSAKHVNWSIRWWTEHSGPHLVYFGHGTQPHIGQTYRTAGTTAAASASAGSETGNATTAGNAQTEEPPKQQ